MYSIDTPWSILNTLKQVALKMMTVREEITKYSSRYNIKFENQPNELTFLLCNEGEFREPDLLICRQDSFKL